MILDVTGAIVTKWRADVDLMTLFAGQIFADRVPADIQPPFAVVRDSGVDPTVAEVETWDGAAVLVDVVGDPSTVSALKSLAGRLRAELASLRGTTISEIVVQHVNPVSAIFGDDPTYTPALPRWVLATSLVVRSN